MINCLQILLHCCLEMMGLYMIEEHMQWKTTVIMNFHVLVFQMILTELLHSALDLNYTDSIRNDSTESSIIQIADGVSLDLELPFILQLKLSPIVVPVDGYLTCRSRKSGREQSIYIGGA